jgi:hypothetical protein
MTSECCPRQVFRYRLACKGLRHIGCISIALVIKALSSADNCPANRRRRSEVTSFHSQWKLDESMLISRTSASDRYQLNRSDGVLVRGLSIAGWGLRIQSAFCKKASKHTWIMDRRTIDKPKFSLDGCEYHQWGKNNDDWGHWCVLTHTQLRRRHPGCNEHPGPT